MNDNYIGSHIIKRIRGHYEVYNAITKAFVCSGDTSDEALDELIIILKEKYKNTDYNVEEAI